MQTILHTPFLTPVFLLYPHENYQKKKKKKKKEPKKHTPFSFLNIDSKKSQQILATANQHYEKKYYKA